MAQHLGEGFEDNVSGQQPWHRRESSTRLRHVDYRRRVLEETTRARSQFLAVYRRALRRQASSRD